MLLLALLKTDDGLIIEAETTTQTFNAAKLFTRRTCLIKNWITLLCELCQKATAENQWKFF